MDGSVLRFLGMSDAEFSADICSEADDEAGIRRALANTSRSAAERLEFSTKMERQLKFFRINRCRRGTSAARFPDECAQVFL